MAQSFFFYDLETSGFSPREARIMQFAGQRTDLELKPIGEPVNTLIKLSEDILPDPQAILITGITPQKTLQEGINEADFLKLFSDKVSTKDTIFVGYNSVRFDDEFMRFLQYRNFYDPYEWQWRDGRSRWDLLDVVRMTRALRPDGIKWPYASDGKPSNRLELLASVNKLNHEKAHDALSDVEATIAIARMIFNKQPRLFNFLLTMRDKKKVSELVLTGEPFIYTSVKYPSEFEKTTVAVMVTQNPTKQGALVYDLRQDPDQFSSMTVAQLVESWQWHKDETVLHLPIKTLQFNRCPAVAPLSVLDESSKVRLKLDIDLININHQKLINIKDWPDKLLQALDILDKKQQTRFIVDKQDVDSQLYDGFFEDQDRTKMEVVRAAKAEELSDLSLDFKDQRLTELLPLYKARNFPQTLTNEERVAWEKYRYRKLFAGAEKSRLAKFLADLENVKAPNKPKSEQEYLIEELKLWAESIILNDDDV
jgi:exodeoxyribonuclease-1